MGIAFDKNGLLYVANHFKNGVRVLRRDGTVVRSFGSYGRGDGQFDGVHALALSADGEVFVGDQGNDRIQVLIVVGCGVSLYFDRFSMHTENFFANLVAEANAKDG